MAASFNGGAGWNRNGDKGSAGNPTEIDNLVKLTKSTTMEVSIYEAKTHLSKLIEAVERGEEVIVARRNKPVAKIVPVTQHRGSRIGGLAGRPFKLGKAFDSVPQSEELGNLFGVPEE